MNRLLILLILLFSGTFISSTVETDKKVKYGLLYSINIPGYMYEMEDLNSSASLQYGYVKRKKDQTDELYVIVIHETHDNLADMGLKFTTMEYWEMGVSFIYDGTESAKIEEANSKPEMVNGMKCVNSKMTADFGDFAVYYDFSVYNGKYGFYQVLCWTILDQRDKFEKTMEKMVNSFKEL